ncbi:hypothetical protein IJJ49_02230 [Candidatus Saccharibacteria bacterium]|nr:hypothetical protein [Candidatus Saccharibacteria bacterium]
MAREINLVPDIKGEMIRALKLRNFIFFLCIVVAAASVAVTLIFGMIVGGQQLAVDGKKNTIDNLSNKVNSYADLTDFLTIKDQLGNLSNIADNKKVLSRTFGILSAIIPTGADTITLSELSVVLSDTNPTFSFDAQADAKKEPFIDYNVLDAFKKSMQYMTFDYGRYVDKDGNKIPTYCIVETGTDGATLKDSARGIYAYWTILETGCNPDDGYEEEEELPTEPTELEEEVVPAEVPTVKGYDLEEYNGKYVVRVWRTPQYDDWYNKKYLELDGSISGIAHFESECTRYSGVESASGTIKWDSENTTCMLVPDGTDGISITDSSNGRGASGELVLRFSAKIAFSPEVYKFENKHMLSFAPEGRYNVTDSYTQIQAMFGERAADCAEGDAACKDNGGNS